MTSQEKGAEFEKTTNDFFIWLFTKIGFVVTKARTQKSGSQDGFDIQLTISQDYIESSIYIECKNYESDLSIGNIVKKCWELKNNYKLKQNDLFIAISPKYIFKNTINSDKSKDFLNDTFPFHSELLDKSNNIENLFAINNFFYEKVYKKKLDYKVDEEEEINKFKNIIFSRKPFRKITLSEEDKKDYLKKGNLLNHYIPRHLSHDNKQSKLNFTDVLSNEMSSLEGVLKREDKIIILGNAGLGKSTELYHFANLKWKIGVQKDYIPIYINLKNFTLNNSINDFLPKEFEDIAKCYLIFDGIDEVQNPQDFISKLEEFIDKAINQYKSIKYILSCRTNIYESTIYKIQGFNPYYLDNLSNKEAFYLLNKLVGEDLVNRLKFKSIHSDFLKNPYLINILSEYIIVKDSLPNNSLDLWSSYITKRLNEDKKNKFQKQKLNPHLIKSYSQKISLISELMKSSFIEEDLIHELLLQDFDEYLKSPLIEKNLNNSSWSFEHKSIQEFFASQYLSKLPIDEIIDFIQIPSTNKTHPSFFNIISFLLNILEDKKREKFIDFLLKEEAEILFTADLDRVNIEIRNKVFRNYFNKICIENTFWISHNNSFRVEDIARFGDSEENYYYLISLFKNTENHFRVIISALSVLQHMTTPLNHLDNLKKLFLSKLKEKDNLDSSKLNENNFKIKNEIIDCIKKHELDKDSVFLEEVIEVLKGFDNEETNKKLFRLICSLDEGVDKYFYLIENEFFKKTKKSNYNVDIIFFEGAFTKVQDIFNFKIILSYFFKETSNNYKVFNESLTKKILSKCREELIKNFSFIDDILSIIKDENWIRIESYLLYITNEINVKAKVIDKILNNETLFDKGKYLLTRLISKENIDLIVKKFSEKGFESHEVEEFRNIINNVNSNGKELASIFEDKMTSRGSKFEEVLLDRDKSEENRKIKTQQNFEKLFNKEKLKEEVNLIYKKIGVEQIDWEILFDYENKWHEQNGYSEDMESSIIVLSHIIRRYGSSTKEKISSLLNSETIIIEEINNFIQQNKIEVNDFQKEYIKKWCENSIEKIDYDKIISIKGVVLDYFEVYKNIYLFQKKFNFELPIEFYKKTLKYSDESLSNENDLFLFIKEKINDEDEFNNLVIDVINNNKTIPFSLREHIKYALDKDLKLCYAKIKDLILNNESLAFSNSNLINYFQKTNDIGFLKEICNNSTGYSYWKALELLMLKNIEKDFVIKKAKDYLDTNQETHRMDALGILFKFNSSKAIELFLEFINKGFNVSIKYEYYSNYNNEKGVDLIEQLYRVLYPTEELNSFKFYDERAIFKNYLILNSGEKESVYYKIKEKLNTLKGLLEEESKEVFYINTLIENTTNSFINFKSKPFSFEDAKNKVLKA